MKNVTPIYDVWLREYDGAERETLFSIDTERPELYNLSSRDVLAYAEEEAFRVVAYLEQAVECILTGDKVRNCIPPVNADEAVEEGWFFLETSLASFYLGNYHYEEMQDAIEVLADRDFMMHPDTAQLFLYVIQIWQKAYNGGKSNG